LNVTDWEPLLIGYNRIYHTHYASLKDFLSLECEKLGFEEFSVRLGVGVRAIRSKQKELGVSLRQKYGPAKIDEIKKEAEAGRLDGLTIKEIEEIFQLSRGYANKLVHRFNIDFKRVKAYSWKKVDGSYVKRYHEVG